MSQCPKCNYSFAACQCHLTPFPEPKDGNEKIAFGCIFGHDLSKRLELGSAAVLERVKAALDQKDREWAEKLEAQEDTSSIQGTLIKGFQGDLSKSRAKITQLEADLNRTNEALRKIKKFSVGDFSVETIKRKIEQEGREIADWAKIGLICIESLNPEGKKEIKQPDYFCKEPDCKGHGES